MKEVYPGIFQITVRGFLARLRPEVNVFVITGPDGMVFDAAYGTRGVGKFLVSEIEKIEQLCRDRGEECRITRVMTSHGHGDHYSGMKYLRKKLDLKILVSEKTARSIGSMKKYRESFERHDPGQWYSGHGFFYKVACWWGERFVRSFFHLLYGHNSISDPDAIFTGNTILSINGKTWQAIPAPGHSFDHIHLYNRDEGLLFAGDNVLRGVPPWLGPPESDLKEYLSTLNSILDLPGLEMLFCGHGSPVSGPYERVRRLLRYRLDRIEDLYDIISGKGSEGVTFNEIADFVYMNESGFKKNLGRGWIAVTLRHLEREGRIACKGQGRKVRLYAAGTKI